ncbi:methyl-CpG-binding domain-containing protein 9-like [Diospyros lotus]|uniref:methyl-CpG-binding domain-containing protein 9-like n=1 Tax=Diospyros lotus TaxID=55363 RepID=UPI0022563788|nr:methyl-CpG-binding domain-containing protein 9-like [Diospyros lotus]
MEMGMEVGKLPGPEPDTNVRPGARSRPFEIDLNEAPLPSPRETLAACGSCGAAGEVEGEMLFCHGCGRGFHMKCLGTKEGQKPAEWKCFKCLFIKRPRRGVELIDMNASPPQEAEGEGFIREAQNSGKGVQASNAAEQNGDKMHIVRDISFISHSLSAPVTTSNFWYLEDGFNILKASHDVPQVPKLGFGDMVQCRLDRTSKVADFSTTCKEGLWPSYCTPLNYLPQSQSEVYLQALREYVHEKHGLLGDGWHVEFFYCKKGCKTIAVYCAPDGSRFESMPDVARHLGLPTSNHSLEIEDRSERFSSPQKGLNSNRRRKDLSRLSRANNHKEGQNARRSSSEQQAGKFVSSRSVAAAIEHEHGFEGVFPLQFEDLFVLSLGKVDPRSSYHNAHQIWPIGYRSCWHDKITGSIFVSEVVDGGDTGPNFKVQRYPCSTHHIPIGSTVLLRQKSDSYDGQDKMTSDDSTTSEMFDDESPNIQMMLREDSPPHLEDVDLQKANSSPTEPSYRLQRYVDIIPGDSGLDDDCIGEFSVEGRSSSLAWDMAAESLIRACHESYKKTGILQFFCKHDMNGVNCKAADSIDSLSKFCCLYGPPDIPHLIQSPIEFATCSGMLMEWLRQDRFGLDVEFVQEILEQLPGVHSCSNYKVLNERIQNSGSQTVKSGFLLAKRKSNMHGRKGTDGSLLSYKRPQKQLDEDSDMRKSFPLGKPLSAKIPAYLIGDVLQVWEFLWRFSEVLGLEEPFSFQQLENELMNPWLNPINPLEGSQRVGKNCEDAMLCTGAVLRKAHGLLLKVLIGELLLKVGGYVDPNSDAGECKSRRGRKRDADNSSTLKKMKFDMLQMNGLTWPELARRYILVVLSMEGKPESVEITYRESSKIIHCLQGDGGTLCGSLTGAAGMEADALLLAEALKQVFGAVKKSDFVSIEQQDSDAMSSPQMIKVNGSEVPEWAQALEPVKKLPTNVGARIRKCVHNALDKNPPEWAKTILEHSISKEVYKGNASGPTKRAIVSLLADMSHKNLQPKPEKKEKKKKVNSISDLIMKQCRIVLRCAAAEDEDKIFCNLLGRTLLSPVDNDDEGLIGYPAMVSRPIDFRTIDVRLASGAYGGSHEAFLEDVQEVWKNIRTIYADKYDLAEALYQKFEDLYEKEVLTLVQKLAKSAKSLSTSDEAKREVNDMLVHANESSLPKAPWDDGICKVCGVDKDDDNVLLCDTCDSEYHTYCLSPPLAKIPEGNWYCPSCVVGQFRSQGTSHGTTRVNWCQKKKYRGEFTQNSMEKLSWLARTMGSKEYWEFNVEERIFLMKFLCDETLNSSIIREHLDHCAYMSSDLQQKLRAPSSEWKILKLREEILIANLEKSNARLNRIGEFIPDGLASMLNTDGKLMGQAENRSNYIPCCSGNVLQLEQWNEPSDSQERSEKPLAINRNQSFEGSDALGQVKYQHPVKGQYLIHENHIPRTYTGAQAGHWQDELPLSISQQEKHDARGENDWSSVSSQQGLEDSSGNGLLLTTSQVTQGASANSTTTPAVEHVPGPHKNLKHVDNGHQSSSQSDNSVLQAHYLELSSLKHEISVLQESIAHLESEFQKVSLRKEYLGRDSAGRAYWGFSRQEGCLLMVDGSAEVQQSEVTKFTGPTENNPSLMRHQFGVENPSSSKLSISNIGECKPNIGIGTSAWMSYQLDTEIGELVGWLRDGDARERDLKESILQWQRNKWKDPNNAENHIQNEKEPTRLKLSGDEKATGCHFIMTRALTALEKKYGPCVGSETFDIPKQLDHEVKVTCERMLHRCKCLEPIWPSRHHCLACHQTCSTSEELEQHNNGISCAGSLIPGNNRINEDSRKRKEMVAETPAKHPDDNDRTSRSEKNETSSNLDTFREPECPYDFEEISTKFVTHNCLKELVRDVGFMGTSVDASFLTAVSPYLTDPALGLVSTTTRTNGVICGNESTALENQLQQSTRGTNTGVMNFGSNLNNFSPRVGNSRNEVASQVERLISNSTHRRDVLSSVSNTSQAHGVNNCCFIPESSLKRLVGKFYQILRHLKINLLDMDAALPEEALRPSMAQSEKRYAWRAFVKSAGSIYEMVQAIIVFENMIKADYLRKDWWYWSSLSAAANVSTLSALALRLYALDAAIIFEKLSPTTDSTENLKPGSPNLDTGNDKKASSPLIQKTDNNPTDSPKPKGRPHKRRKDTGG